MSTSGSIDFDLSVSDIITEAYSLIRVGVDGESLTSDQTTSARRTLNMMFKAWQTDGLRLWCKTEGILFLTEGTAKYSIGPTGTARSTLVTDFIETALDGDHTTSDTTLEVASITGIAASDIIGIELAVGTLHWTTVSGAPAGSIVTIATGLPSAANDEAVIYTYTTALERPLRILDARRRTGDIDTPIMVLERPEYFDQANKASSGAPTQLYHDPQLTLGYVYLWPTPDDETEQVRFTFERHINDVDTLANTADLPAEWLEALTYNLAARLTFKTNSLPMDERAALMAVAADMKRTLDGWDREYGSVTFTPDYQ